jgi:hypothetical protein
MLDVTADDAERKGGRPANGFVQLSARDQHRIARLVVARAYACGRPTLDFAVLLRDGALFPYHNDGASFARGDARGAEAWCLQMLQAGYYLAVAYKDSRGWSGPAPCVSEAQYWPPVEYSRPYEHSEGCAIFSCGACNCPARIQTGDHARSGTSLRSAATILEALRI